jgi:hypothetical protein
MEQNKIREDFGYLGKDFQLKLINEIIKNNKLNEAPIGFGEDIIDHIHPKYFTDDTYKELIVFIKDYYNKYKLIPNLDNIYQIISSGNGNEIRKKVLTANLTKIKELRDKVYAGDLNNDSEHIQESTNDFIIQQQIEEVHNLTSQYLENGQIHSKLDEVIELYKKIGEIKDKSDYGTEMAEDDIDNLLDDDYRNPIPTGISKLDKALDGGIGKGEMAFFLAAQGVGKSTILTKIANNGAVKGKNVLHIIFEDNIKAIKRKHLSLFTDIPLKELNNRKEEAKKRWKNFKKDFPNFGNLVIKKFPQEETTIPKIKKFIQKKQKKAGFDFDLVVLDYIDCVESHKHYGNTWDNEMVVVKSFESMLAELNIAGASAVQGKKESNQKRILDMNDCGGSIAKLKKAHIIVSIGRDLPQKQAGRANLALLKSRIGEDGHVWEDSIFNNNTMKIELSDNEHELTSYTSQTDTQNSVTKEDAELIREALKSEHLI